MLSPLEDVAREEDSEAAPVAALLSALHRVPLPRRARRRSRSTLELVQQPFLALRSRDFGPDVARRIRTELEARAVRSPWLERLPEGCARYLGRPATQPWFRSDSERALFVDWFVHDYVGPDGRTLVVETLEHHRDRRAAEEVSCLEAWVDSHVSVYEVIAVEPGRAVTVRELDGGEGAIRVDAPHAAAALVRWDLAVGRLVRHGPVQVFSTGFVRCAAGQREALSELLVECRAEGAEPAEGLKRHGHRLLRFATARDATPSPALRTQEGEAILPSRAELDCPRPDRLAAELLRADDFVLTTPPPRAGSDVGFAWTGERDGTSDPADAEDDGSLDAWVVDLERSEYRRAVAELRIEGHRLTVFCLSPQRLDRLRLRLRRGPLGGIELRLVRIRHSDEPLDRSLLAAAGAGVPISDDLVARWLDTPMRLLGGMSPRAAAATDQGRERLEWMLRRLENLEARRRQVGLVGDDVAALRRALGMDGEPGSR